MNEGQSRVKPFCLDVLHTPNWPRFNTVKVFCELSEKQRGNKLPNPTEDEDQAELSQK